MYWGRVRLYPMTTFLSFLDVVDALLIAPFRAAASPETGFLLGTFLLAVASVALGRLSKAAVAFMHSGLRQKNDQELARRQELSVMALKAGDKAAYIAQNRLAKDAYGLHMALASARGAALLWPGAASLGWLSWRFTGIPLPFTGDLMEPTGYFILIYIFISLFVDRLLRRVFPTPRNSRNR